MAPSDIQQDSSASSLPHWPFVPVKDPYLPQAEMTYGQLGKQCTLFREFKWIWYTNTAKYSTLKMFFAKLNSCHNRSADPKIQENLPQYDPLSLPVSHIASYQRLLLQNVVKHAVGSLKRRSTSSSSSVRLPGQQQLRRPPPRPRKGSSSSFSADTCEDWQVRGKKWNRPPSPLSPLYLC